MTGHGRGCGKRYVGNRKGITTPAAASRKQTQRRQMSPAEAAALAMLLAMAMPPSMPPVVQGSDNSFVLELLMDLSSCMLVTDEYITQRKEANAIQSLLLGCRMLAMHSSGVLLPLQDI